MNRFFRSSVELNPQDTTVEWYPTPVGLDAMVDIVLVGFTVGPGFRPFRFGGFHTGKWCSRSPILDATGVRVDNEEGLSVRIGCDSFAPSRRLAGKTKIRTSTMDKNQPV